MEAFPSLPIKYYSEIRQEIFSGDILLCSGSSLFSTLIQKATGSVWSHVAFIVWIAPIKRIMVLESVESIGVRAVPLSSYVCNYNGTGKGYPGRLMLARHRQLKSTNITKLSHSAIDYLGYPYRQAEIVHIASRLSLHHLGLPDAKPDSLDQQAFICSEYAYVCFKSIGIKIDYNPIGFIAPCDFANSIEVKPIYFIHTEPRREALPQPFQQDIAS